MFARTFHTGCLAAGLLGCTGLAAMTARPAAAQMTPLTVALPTVTQYSDRGSFTAASSGLTTLDFGVANTSGGTLTGYATASGLTLSGVNFVGTENSGQYTLAVITPAFFAVYAGFSGNPTGLIAGDNGAYNSPIVTVTLPPGTMAVGTDLYTFRLGNGYANTAEPVDVTLYSGGVSLGTFRVITFEKPTLAFAGFVSTVPITALQVQGENDSIADLSTFAFGTSLAAAKPPTNNGVKIAVSAVAQSSPPANGQAFINIGVTATNNGSSGADMFQITSVTFNSAVPLPVPPSASPIPTTPNLLVPGHSQTNTFTFRAQPGTVSGVFKASGTYIDTVTGKSGSFTTTIRSLPAPPSQ